MSSRRKNKLRIKNKKVFYLLLFLALTLAAFISVNFVAANRYFLPSESITKLCAKSCCHCIEYSDTCVSEDELKNEIIQRELESEPVACGIANCIPAVGKTLMVCEDSKIFRVIDKTPFKFMINQKFVEFIRT